MVVLKFGMILSQKVGGRESATNATYSKYTESAQDGTMSVLISNTSTSNKRLGSDDIKLSVGNYTLSVYAKNAVAGATANMKVGYVLIKEDGTVDSGKYNYVSGTTAIALTDEWTKYEYSIELEAEQTVSIVFMSSGSKSVAAKDMLIDNASLVVKK
ncbi:carbohydrate binding domain-containing protein [Bacteroides ovatus]|nr:carbohydrate binding domain-containing protein [Bacteroides ovatus]UVP78665.1 carbohydrate binding domain-containing protein [Bacteroides ovatus]